MVDEELCGERTNWNDRRWQTVLVAIAITISIVSCLVELLLHTMWVNMRANTSLTCGN